MNTSLLNTILILFIFAYFFAAWVFMMRQKQGASFIESCDKAFLKGGLFFALTSGISYLGAISGSFTQPFI